MVGKQVCPVLNYVAGWELHSLPMSQMVAKEKHASYEKSTQQQNVGEELAKEFGMSVSD